MNTDLESREVPVVVVGPSTWYVKVAELFLPYYTVPTHLNPTAPITQAHVLTTARTSAAILVIDGSGRHPDDIRATVDAFHRMLRADQRPVEIIVGATMTPMGSHQYVVTNPNDIVKILPTLVAARIVDARQEKTKVLAVGCSKGGVGKTVITLSYAQALARLGANTLVIEADISNASIGSTLRLNDGGHAVQSYLALLRANSDTPYHAFYGLENCQYTVFPNTPWQFSVLLAATKDFTPLQGDNKVVDLTTGLFSKLLTTATSMTSSVTQSAFDVILVDTSPDIYPRPYLFQVLQSGGYAVIPLLPGYVERESVNAMYAVFDQIAQQLPPDTAAKFWSRIMIQPVAGERGAVVSIETVLRSSFLNRWRERGVTVLDPLPRDPALLSSTVEDSKTVPLLQKGEHRAFGVAMYRNAADIAKRMGIPVTPYQPDRWTRFKISLARLIGRDPLRVASGAVEQSTAPRPS